MKDRRKEEREEQREEEVKNTTQDKNKIHKTVSKNDTMIIDRKLNTYKHTKHNKIG